MITPEQKIELYKYWKDPIYAMESLLHIVDRDGKELPFRLTDNQKMIMVGMEYHRFNVVKKGRILGADSILAAWVAYKCVVAYDIVNPDNILFNTHMGEASYSFLRLVKYFADQIPDWVWNHSGSYKDMYKTDTKKELVFFNRCRLKTTCTSKDALRGWNPSHLIMDNASFYGDEAIDIFGAMLTTLGVGGCATVISTPNGKDSFFEPLYTQAESMTNNFNSINMHWAYDYRFNEHMYWSKDGMIEYEKDYTRKSITEKLAYGWKPASIWSQEMTDKIFRDGYGEDYLNQELHGEFVEYKPR